MDKNEFLQALYREITIILREQEISFLSFRTIGTSDYHITLMIGSHSYDILIETKRIAFLKKQEFNYQTLFETSYYLEEDGKTYLKEVVQRFWRTINGEKLKNTFLDDGYLRIKSFLKRMSERYNLSRDLLKTTLQDCIGSTSDQAIELFFAANQMIILPTYRKVGENVQPPLEILFQRMDIYHKTMEWVESTGISKEFKEATPITFETDS